MIILDVNVYIILFILNCWFFLYVSIVSKGKEIIVVMVKLFVVRCNGLMVFLFNKEYIFYVMFVIIMNIVEIKGGVFVEGRSKMINFVKVRLKLIYCNKENCLLVK